MNKIISIFTTLFGIGYSPIAPGTIGSIFSIVFLYFLIKFVSYSFLIIIFLIIFFTSLKLIEKYSNLLKSHDSSTIVIDEFLGIFLIILFYDYLKFANDFIMFLLIFLTDEYLVRHNPSLFFCLFTSLFCVREDVRVSDIKWRI